MPEFAEDMGKNEVEKEQDEEIERPGIFSKISAQTIKQIMELLCDESVSLKTGHCCMPNSKVLIISYRTVSKQVKKQGGPWGR